MRARAIRIAAIGLTLGLVAGGLRAQVIGSKQKTGPRSGNLEPKLVGKPYRSLTNTRRTFTNFNVEVVRGFVLRPDGDELETYAVHAYESSVVRFRGTEETGRWRTLNNPVSIALHAGDLWVVGQGNHALARHDLPSGEILDVLMLPSEPADIVIDPDHGEAWVSCMGGDAVVQIALTEPMRAVKVWSWDDGLLLKRPRFLFLDRGTPDPGDNAVYVAPLISGNNTLSFSTGTTGSSVIDGSQLPGGGLPDEDLFRITRAGPGAGKVEPVLRGVGSIILGHGRNPADGRYHVLTVDHNNFDPNMLSEPSVRGKFADNLLAIAEPETISTSTGPMETGPLPGPDTVIDLDDHDPDTPGAQYAADRSLSFPYGLAFEPGTGRVAIASSTTPLVAIYSPGGDRQVELALPGPGDPREGLVPRSLAFDRSGRLHVYCQETSNILVYDPSEPEEPVAALDLGHDPTPDPVRRGRRIWYDARPSLDGRTTCNTCHVQGGADGIAWFLSGVPVDHKDVMVTQTLFGIEDSFPYHWRGERDLEAFNGAFPGLLGHPGSLEPEGELEEFVEFVFSLTGPANPLQTGPVSIDAEGRVRQDFDRRLKNELVDFPLGAGLTPFGSFTSEKEFGQVTRGDDVFHDVPSLEGRSCVDCHLNPTGSLGDALALNPSAINSSSTIKIAHLDTQLTLKHQPVVELLDPNGNLIPRNLLGFGASHRGDDINLLDSVMRFLGNISPQEVLDVTAFLHLFDHGIAPSVHFAALLDEDSPEDTAFRIQRWLLDQAADDWVGVVVIGTFPDGPGGPDGPGELVPMHWFYDAERRLFVPEGAEPGPRRFAAFNDFEAHPGMRNVFLGTPPGNERRLGIGFDADGLSGGEETVDAEAPALIPGSLELDFVNAVSAKLFFETSEPCTWSITLTTPAGPDVSEDRLTADTVHTAVVQRLLPSTTGKGVAVEVRNRYSGSLVLTDLAGNSSAPIPLPDFTTRSMIHEGTLASTVIGDLTLSNEARSATTYSALASLRVDFKEQSPPSVPATGFVVVAQVLKQEPNGLDWSIVPLSDLVHDAVATDFKFGSKLYSQTLPGPFLIPLATDAGGTASVDFTVLGLSANQKVMFNVLAMFAAPTGWTQGPPSTPSKFGLVIYQLPSTPEQLRSIVSTR